MADFVMIMMGTASDGDWDAYVEKLLGSGRFRGGSSLGNGVALTKGENDGECRITGYIRLTSDSIDDAKILVAGNPLYEAGGRVELLEEIPD